VRAGEYLTSASTGSMLMISLAEALPAQRRGPDGNPEVRVFVNVIQRAAERLDRDVQDARVLVVELDEMMRLANRGDLHLGSRRALRQQAGRDDGHGEPDCRNFPHGAG
jgi:hypothetical protein